MQNSLTSFYLAIIAFYNIVNITVKNLQ